MQNTQNMPFFSVVIPVYNKAKYLESTLNSVLSQTLDDYEIILIDDGSVDDPNQIIRLFTTSKINYYYQENAGVSAARNAGIDKSIGKYIAFLDADDFWYPNHLQELKTLILDFPDCGMYCNRYKIKTSARHFQEISFRGINATFRGIVGNYFYSNIPFRIPTASSVALSKNILTDLEGFDIAKSSGEDVELWTKVGLKFPVAISNKTTVIYNFETPSSLSKQVIHPNQIMDFTQFEAIEKNNLFLKEFLDLHRFFYAIQFKAWGNENEAELIFRKINPKNIRLINHVLFKLPGFILRFLYKIKRQMKKIGIEFSTYN